MRGKTPRKAMLVAVATRRIDRQRRHGIRAVEAELNTRHSFTERASRQLRRQEENESTMYDESETDRDGKLRPPKPARTDAHPCRPDSHARYAMTL